MFLAKYYKKFIRKLGLISVSDSLAQYKKNQLHLYSSYGVKNDIKSLFVQNANIINRLKHNLSFNDSEFELWVQPLLEYIANYYLLLPASYDNHHRDAGGSFVHAIETANIAIFALYREENVYRSVPTEHKNKYKSTCQLSLLTLALLHDTGKPISDYNVFACDQLGLINKNIDKWDPTKETISDWVTAHKIEFYRICYVVDRVHKLHENYIAISLNRIEKTLQSFKYSSILIKQINETISGAEKPFTKVLNNLVLAGDRGSANFYTKSYGRLPRDSDMSSKIIRALETYHFESKPSEFNISQKPFFHTTLGMHIYYPSGLNKIYEVLKEFGDYLPNKDKSPADVIVSILNETNHLLIIGNHNELQPAVHDLYVEKITNDIKTWVKVKVISLKQPHMYQLLQSSEILNATTSPVDKVGEVIPKSARATPQHTNSSFYEKFEPKVIEQNNEVSTSSKTNQPNELTNETSIAEIPNNEQELHESERDHLNEPVKTKGNVFFDPNNLPALNKLKVSHDSGIGKHHNIVFKSIDEDSVDSCDTKQQLESEQESNVEPRTNQKSNSKPKPETTPKSDSNEATKANQKTSSKTKPKTTPKSDSNVATKANQKTSSKPKSETTPKSDSDVVSKANQKTNSKPKPKTTPKSDSNEVTKANQKTAAKLKNQTKSKLEISDKKPTGYNLVMNYLKAMGITKKSDPEFIIIMPIIMESLIAEVNTHRTKSPNSLILKRTFLIHKSKIITSMLSEQLNTSIQAIKLLEDKDGLLWEEVGGGWQIENNFLQIIIKEANNEN